MNILDEKVTILKGIGENRSKILKKLNINTLSDLINYFPRGYIDMSAKIPINDLLDGQTALVCGKVVTGVMEKRINPKVSLYKFRIADPTGSLMVTLFNQRFTAEKIKGMWRYTTSCY
jgi:ATP-dependent DNA helicase RecG